MEERVANCKNRREGNNLVCSRKIPAGAQSSFGYTGPARRSRGTTQRPNRVSRPFNSGLLPCSPPQLGFNRLAPGAAPSHILIAYPPLTRPRRDSINLSGTKNVRFQRIAFCRARCGPQITLDSRLEASFFFNVPSAGRPPNGGLFTFCPGKSVPFYLPRGKFQLSSPHRRSNSHQIPGPPRGRGRPQSAGLVGPKAIFPQRFFSGRDWGVHPAGPAISRQAVFPALPLRNFPARHGPPLFFPRPAPCKIKTSGWSAPIIKAANRPKLKMPAQPASLGSPWGQLRRRRAFLVATLAQKDLFPSEEARRPASVPVPFLVFFTPLDRPNRVGVFPRAG